MPKDPDTLWPRSWLVEHPELQDVRVFTFGYHSDWTESDSSILNLHDFGSYLFDELCATLHLDQEDEVLSSKLEIFGEADKF